MHPSRRALLRRIILASAVLCGAVVPSAHAGEIKPWKGGKTPALKLPDLDGTQHTLEQFKGKVVIVNFWATWCEPCRAEMPSMQKLADQFGPDKLVILGVNYQEGEPRIRRFLQQNPIKFTVLMDRDGEVTKRWITRIFPTSLIIAPDGRIRHLVQGEYDWESKTMQDTIAKLLAGGAKK